MMSSTGFCDCLANSPYSWAEALSSVRSSSGNRTARLPAMARLVMSHPRLGPAFGQLFAQIMFEPGSLSRRERELVAAVAASAQDCFY